MTCGKSPGKQTVYYLEASALVKRYKTEPGTQVLNLLFEPKSSDEVLITSQWTIVELEAALARALKGRTLNRRAYNVILALLAQDLSETIIVHPVSSVILSDAAGLARRRMLRAGDALHLAHALRLSQALPPKTVVVASDDELLTAARAEGLETLDPKGPDAIDQLEGLRAS